MSAGARINQQILDGLRAIQIREQLEEVWSISRLQPQRGRCIHDEALRRQVQRHVELLLPDASMRRELFALHLLNPERVKANLRFASGYLRSAPVLAEPKKSRGLSGGDILNVCLNSIHADSRNPDPAKWLVTEELLAREVKRTRAAKAKHGGKDESGQRIGFRA